VDSTGASSLVDLRTVSSLRPELSFTKGQKWLILINWPLLETHDALQRTNTENLKQIFPEKELRGQSPNFHIHVFVSDLYIHTIDLPVLLQKICG
jgi:hypothetical protein